MAMVNAPQQQSVYRTVYQQFRGVHLTDPYLCDVGHSPYAMNLISNNEGLPEIRPGFRTIHPQGARVNALAKGYIAGEQVFLAHCGAKLYKWTDKEIILLHSGLSDEKSSIFFATHENETKAWIMTGAQYLVYDGVAVKSVEEIATVPTILIAKSPSGGGTLYEPINLLQPKRTECFAGNGNDRNFYLSAKNIDSDDVKVMEIKSSGEVERTNFTVDRALGRITFSVAPDEPLVVGTDNIKITYAKTIEGYANRIKACQICTEYGETGTGRIFVTGNGDYRNYDWWSQTNDPSYFPDLNYGVTGSANTAIMGYCKLGQYQLLIKEDNQQDTTVFLRYPATLNNGDTYFRLEPGIAGKGAIAKRTFVTLVDEPLFLSHMGLFAITSNKITAERTLENRSYFVDEKLTKEANLQDAVATEWNGYYLLCVNQKVYAFNARSKEAHSMSYVYNCFVWDNIDARCFMEYDGMLYFGDSQGNICKFNTDLYGGAQYNDNGQAINVAWATKMDNDNIPFMLKTMTKKGSGITTKPFTRSSYDIYVVTEKNSTEEFIKNFNRDIFDLNDMDLDRFSLETSPFAKFTPFANKVKNYESLQIIVRGNAINEGFGIYNIVKQWRPVNYVKR